MDRLYVKKLFCTSCHPERERYVSYEYISWKRTLYVMDEREGTTRRTSVYACCTFQGREGNFSCGSPRRERERERDV